EGIRWFVKECWPSILSEFPGAKLKITGEFFRSLPEFQEQPGIELPGFVPDLDGLYQSATLVIAPVTVGSGVKVKVLEAIAHGRAAVISVIAAEGLEEAAAVGAVVVAKDRDEFITQVCRLSRDVLARHNMELLARSWMKYHHQRSVEEACERIFKHFERSEYRKFER
ncbi:MAG: glycosyltransferase family 4 protein, partial [Nitrososphaera sp.]|nr:glycosyltransferase family 4 protein [Nitrososphaera sp.]